jgi:uncharacterized membrane protein YidH (DUF202 family)
MPVSSVASMTPSLPSLFLFRFFSLASARGAFLVKISEFLRRGFCNREKGTYIVIAVILVVVIVIVVIVVVLTRTMQFI